MNNPESFITLTALDSRHKWHQSKIDAFIDALKRSIGLEQRLLAVEQVFSPQNMYRPEALNSIIFTLYLDEGDDSARKIDEAFYDSYLYLYATLVISIVE